MDTTLLENSLVASASTTPPPSFPFRKRRRPALACEECRHRKIKCDRATPCGPCSRSRSKTCTYQNLQDEFSTSAPIVRKIPPRTQLDSALQNQQQPYELVANANSYSSTLSPPASAASSLVQAPSYGSSSTTPEHVQALLDRVQSLEKSLLEVTRNGVNGKSHDIALTQPTPTPASPKAHKIRKKSTYEKTRFCGNNHWMNYIKQFDFMRKVDGTVGKEQRLEMRALVHKYKRLTKASQLKNLTPQSIPLDLRDHVPPKETSDLLIQGYFRTFESVFRIVHIPSFMKEYDDFWSDPKSARDLYVIKLLLVLAIGTCFYQETSAPSSSFKSLRTAAIQWIYSVETWVCAPYQKPKPTLANLEIRCLLLVAKQVNIIDGDHVWISAGGLLRTAMNMGLHRDPSQLYPMSTLNAEHRRRLWATVVELLLQSSMDAGSPVLLSTEDYDCEPPSNVDDSQLDEKTTMPVVSQPDAVFTDSSIQIALAKSFPVRIAIAKLVNDFRSGNSYDETLRLAGDLTVACQQHSAAVQFWQSTSSPESTSAQPSSFQAKLLAVFTNRFLLSLHLPYAIKAKTNKTFFFSRQACFETALEVLAPVVEDAQAHSDYIALRLRGVGLFHDITLLAAVAVAMELTTRLSAPPSSFPSATECAVRAEAHSAIQQYVDMSAARLEAGGQSVKAYAFGSCLLAQIKAMEEGTSIDEEIKKTIKVSTDYCMEVLERRAGGNGGGTPGDLVDESPMGGLDWDSSIPDPSFDFQMPDSWSPFEWIYLNTAQ